MKKLFFTASILLANLTWAQNPNNNSFDLTSSAGELFIRNFSGGDSNWKSALYPQAGRSQSGTTEYILVINRNGGFDYGVQIQGNRLDISGRTVIDNNLTVNQKLGIGAPTSIVDQVQINRAFSFHDGGNDVIFFGANSSGDLNSNEYSSEIRMDPANGKFSLGVANTKSSMPITAFTIDNTGKIGIGSNSPDEKLTVKGKIHAEEIKVDLAVPADYVFQKYFTGSSTLKPDYQMPSLNEIESFVKENHHLPNIPSASEIQQNGLQLGEMNNLLLQKIEELTLYIIEQNKRIDALEAKAAENN